MQRGWSLAAAAAAVFSSWSRSMRITVAGDGCWPFFFPVEKVICEARSDAVTVRQFLTLLAARSQTLAQFEEERACLFGAGIPAEFLPGPREFGRAGLA